MQTNARQFSEATWCTLIGVDHYSSDRLADLRAPARDAASLADALVREDGCTVPRRQVLVAGEGGTVTRRAAEEALGRIADSTDPDSLVIVYFAGHGVSTADGFALCFSDTDLDNLEPTALTETALSELLGRVRCRGLLLILDCCNGAGFAEKAPGFFRRLEQGEFRVLLSSTLADEQSWELPDGGGTVFSSLLLRALRGDEAVGATPGQIYFSELLGYIQDRLDEELEVRRAVGLRQTPVFAGVYPRDPLLFVHRGLLLGGLTVRTARYSRQYVRRMIRRTVLAALALIAFTIGLWYSLLDNYQYTEARGGQIAILKGHPRYNAFGFPKLLWETQIPTTAVEGAESNEAGAYIQSGLGRGVTPKLLARLKPGYRELALHWLGQDDEARASLRRLLSSAAGSRDEMAGAVAQLFADLAEPQDVPTLENLAQQPRSDVRVGGVRGLLRIAPARLRPLLDKGSAAGDRELQREVLKEIPAGDPAAAGDLIRVVLNESTYRAEQSLLLDAALRAGVRLTPEELLHTIERDMSAFPKDEAMYARLTGQEAALAALVDNKMTSPESRADLTKYLFTLGELNPTVPAPDGRPYLQQGDVWEHRAAAYLCLRRHQVAFADLPGQMRTDPWLLTQLAGTEYLNADVAAEALSRLDYSHINISETRSLLDAIVPVIDARAAPFLLRLLDYEDPNDISSDLYLPTLKGLRRLRYDPPAAAEKFFNNESSEVVAEAHLWYAQRHREQVLARLFDRIGDADAEFVPDVFLEVDLTGPELDRLAYLLRGGNESAQKRSAAVLAAKAEPRKVIGLLTSASRLIRSSAADYVALNPKFEEVVAGTLYPYPDPMRLQLKGQEEALESFRTMLSHCPPELRQWRASVASSWGDSIPGVEQRITSSL